MNHGGEAAAEVGSVSMDNGDVFEMLDFLLFLLFLLSVFSESMLRMKFLQISNQAKLGLEELHEISPPFLPLHVCKSLSLHECMYVPHV